MMTQSLFRLSLTGVRRAPATAQPHVLQRSSFSTGPSSSSSSAPLDYDSILKQIRAPHPHNNVSAGVLEKVGRNLHLQQHHPLRTIKKMVEAFCAQYAAEKGQSDFKIFDCESPVVSTQSCFDDLLVPPGHVSRSLSDTYYINESTVSPAGCLYIDGINVN